MRRSAFKTIRLASRSLWLGISLACLGCGRPTPTLVEPPPPTVTVARPVSREVTEYVEFTGNAAAVETVEIKARVSGFITKIHFADGQNVKAGDPLFDIDDRPYRIARDQAAAEVAKNLAELKELENEVIRNQALVPRGAVTQEQFEIVAARRDMAKAMLDKARASLAQAELDLGFCQVVSPLDGRISTRRVNVGDLVSGISGSATPLTMVVSTDPIHVYFNADERSLLVSRERAIKALRAGSAAGTNVEWRNIKDLAIPVDLGLVTDEGYPHRGVLDFVDVAVKAATGTGARVVSGSATTRKHDANGVWLAVSAVKYAMCSSSMCAPSERARLPIRRARMTAPSGSYRYAPSSPSGASAVSPAACSSCVPLASITRAERVMPGLAKDPNHNPSSTTSPPTLTHCASQPAGIASRSNPGPSLIPVGSWAARPNAKSREGE
jgi:RND family efflux transporter MFP subunit